MVEWTRNLLLTHIHTVVITLVVGFVFYVFLVSIQKIKKTK